MNEFDVIVVGAGAAGCFAAIQTATHFPNARIAVLEKSTKSLVKVKVSGGGRCNVTNVLTHPDELSKAYPRGERFLKKAFYQFSSSDMVAWLKVRNVDLKAQSNGCYFPVTDSSQTIIDCFLTELKRAQIPILTQQQVVEITKLNPDKFELKSTANIFYAKSVIVTAGGQPKQAGFDFLRNFGLKVVSPVPSLFTFNLPKHPIVELMGLAQDPVLVKLAGEKWSSKGSLLITHWGMSGPAILKCSAIGARILEQKGYNASFSVNWTGIEKQQEVAEALQELLNSSKQVQNLSVFGIKNRLWLYLLSKAAISTQAIASDLSQKQRNKLLETLVNDVYVMCGKTTFKEEFVTAGGIDLHEINNQTMESKKYPGLFFAGEIMDIDGITGGFNFQAAWTTAYIAGKNALNPINVS